MMTGLTEVAIGVLCMLSGSAITGMIFMTTSYFPAYHRCTQCGQECRGGK